MFMGCYSKSDFGASKSYGGDGGSIAGGVDAAMALSFTYVAIANNPASGHRYAFKTKPPPPDLTLAACDKGCDDGPGPCGCADGYNSCATDRAWAVWQIQAQ